MLGYATMVLGAQLLVINSFGGPKTIRFLNLHVRQDKWIWILHKQGFEQTRALVQHHKSATHAQKRFNKDEKVVTSRLNYL